MNLLYGQATFKIMQALQVHYSTSLDVRVKAATRVKPAIMIPADDNLHLMRLAFQPVELFLNVFSSPGIGQVACVNENVARGDVDHLVMGVGYADDSNSWLATRRNKRLASEEEKDVIEPDSDESQWREEKLVEESEALPLVLPAKTEESEQAHDER